MRLGQPVSNQRQRAKLATLGIFWSSFGLAAVFFLIEEIVRNSDSSWTELVSLVFLIVAGVISTILVYRYYRD